MIKKKIFEDKCTISLKDHVAEGFLCSKDLRELQQSLTERLKS